MTYKWHDVEVETLEELEKYQKSMGFVAKHDTTLPSPAVQPAHGFFHDQVTGGLFSNAGTERDVYHTVVRPEMGFMNALLIASNPFRNPEYDVLTGVNALVGTTAVDACSVAPRPGTAKKGLFTSRFGQLNIQSEQADISQMDGRINRADVDRRLVNGFDFNSPFLPDLVNRQNINETIGLQLFTMAISIEREMLRILFQGENGTDSGIWTDEFDGFDQVFITDPVDVNGNTVGAASSVVVAWGDADVTATVNDADIVQTLAGVTKHLDALGNTTSLASTSVLVMDADLFYRLTEIWPCSYLTDGCAVQSTSQPLNIDSQRQIDMRDDMRRGSFLLVNGVRQMVVPVDGDLLGRTAVGAGFSSTIYRIPMTAMGRKVSYIEPFGLGGPDARGWLDAANAGSNVDFTNGGMYMITSLMRHGCSEFKIHSQPRFVCRTPWLAARITGVNYNLPDFSWNRSADPSGAYFLNGGQYFDNGNI